MCRGVRGIKVHNTWIVNDTTISCEKCRAARWEGCGCRYLLATFPFTGNTWIRNFWDIATGVGAGAITRKGPLPRRHTRFGSPCGTNNGRNHREAYTRIKTNKILHAKFTDLVARVASREGTSITHLPCDLTRRATIEDPLLIKTHHPILRRRGELQKYPGNNLVCGIVHTIRSDTESWCQHHGHERKYWESEPECASGVATNIAKFLKSYDAEFRGVPRLIMDFSLMSMNASYARTEFRRLLNFTSVRARGSLRAAALMHHRAKQIADYPRVRIIPVTAFTRR